MTPEGFFDASAKGAEMLTIVRGLEVFGIDQFYQVLYRPDLVREKLAGDPDGKVKDAAAKLDLAKLLDSGRVPSVAITSHKAQDTSPVDLVTWRRASPTRAAASAAPSGASTASPSAWWRRRPARQAGLSR